MNYIIIGKFVEDINGESQIKVVGKRKSETAPNNSHL